VKGERGEGRRGHAGKSCETQSGYYAIRESYDVQSEINNLKFEISNMRFEIWWDFLD
jgi:hypothetical protein